jgi:DNA-binding NtrC family response regulator
VECPGIGLDSARSGPKGTARSAPLAACDVHPVRVMAREDVTMVPVSGSLAAPSRAPLDTALEDLYRRSLDADGGEALPLREWVRRAEAWRIVQALRECRGNRSAAARSLGIGRRTLYSKMEKLGLGPAWSLSPAPARSN